MMHNTHTLRNTHKRWLTLLALVCVLLIGVSGYMYVPFGSGGSNIAVNEQTEEGELIIEGPTTTRSLPVALSVPSLGIETTFETRLGLTTSGAHEVPTSYEEVGWYEFSPTPGELGPAVVLGHVDSKDGPGVFYALGQLKRGDTIVIDREDGSVLTFEVTLLQRTDQETFPTQEVYGDINHAGLRLITCSGVYDKETLRYSHNLIVYARLIHINVS